MATKNRRRTTRRYRRRRPCDIVPFALQADLQVQPRIDAPNPSLAFPEKYLFPIADGGAFDDLMIEATNALIDPISNVEPYFLNQGMQRGLSWLGAQFHALWYIDEQPAEFMTEAPLIASVRVGFALMRFEWQLTALTTAGTGDIVSGRSIPDIPNLFSRDERFLQDVFLREEVILGPLYTVGDDTNLAGIQQYRDSSGGYLDYVQNTVNDASIRFRVQGGPATSNKQYFKTRSKRRLDETHAIGLCVNIAPSFDISDSFSVRLELHGLQKIKGK